MFGRRKAGKIDDGGTSRGIIADGREEISRGQIKGFEVPILLRGTEPTFPPRICSEMESCESRC
jgi:hypothetical protein